VKRAGALLALVVLLAGCANAQGATHARRALERAGFREVKLSLRSASGIAVARVDVGPGSPPPEQAAEVVWGTLAVRFDQLVVSEGDEASSFSYEALADRLGPRQPSLDRKQVDEEVVRNGLTLMLLLSLGALLSVGAVVGLVVLVLRKARRRMDQAEGPTSGAGDDSPIMGALSEEAAVEGPEAIPS
jgi:hypothetical protein